MIRKINKFKKKLKQTYTQLKFTFAPISNFGNHFKIYNKYKLYRKTNKF